MTDAAFDVAEPPAVSAVNAEGRGRFVLTCEHASNYIPARYGGLGLSEHDLQRHIAWDIGAGELACALSRRLDAPAFLSGYSRLLIDCNRPLGAPTSIVTVSEDTEIPVNQALAEAERAFRAAHYFTPYQDAIAACLDRRAAAGTATVLVGIHSFTPIFRGVARPWPAGVLYRDAAPFAQRLLAALRRDLGPGTPAPIGDNEPYRVGEETDYMVPVHGDARGIPAVLIEVRQDLLSDPAGVEAWASRLAAALDAASA